VVIMSNYEIISKIDEEIFRLEKELNLSKYLEPINTIEQRELFFSALKSGKEYNPQFAYPIWEINTNKIKKEISKLQKQLDKIEGFPLKQAYAEILTSLVEYLDIFEFRSREDFPSELYNLYGSPSDEVVNQAIHILEKQKRGGTEKIFTDQVSDDNLYHFLLDLLQKFDFEWSLELTDDVSSRIAIIPTQKEIKIKRGAKFYYNELERFKVHEFGVHILRYENGNLQPYRIFMNGFDDYLLTEEGLATLAEQRTNNLTLTTLRLYAGRAIATKLAETRSFFSIYNHLEKYFYSEMAFSITQRVKRGLMDTVR